LQWLLRISWGQMLDPPHFMHLFLGWLCSHMLDPALCALAPLAVMLAYLRSDSVLTPVLAELVGTYA